MADPPSSKVRRAFTVHRTGAVLRLRFDTPGARVNIFDARAARELCSILEEVPPGIEAIVLESGKPGSFINGAALMMASAVDSLETAEKVTGFVVRAYDALEASPVPTIAAVRGSCFGCGVELVLRCDVCLGADDAETRFYMTEVVDYLLAPAFGGLSRLPQRLGLERASRFLLDGESWVSDEARRYGLVDEVLSARRFEKTVLDVARELAVGRRKPPRRRARKASPSAKRARDIAALPKALRSLHASCHRLMSEGAPTRRAFRLAVSTASKDASKNALGFFFVRQMAEESSRRGAPPPKNVQLALGEGMEHWRRVLMRPLLRRFDGSLRIRVGPEGTRSVVSARTQPGLGVVRSKILLYGLLKRPSPLVELRVTERSDVKSASLFEMLRRLGVRTVLSRGGEEPVIDRLLRAHLRGLLEVVDGPESTRALRTLFDFGFRSPGRPLTETPLKDLAALIPEASRRRIGRLRQELSTSGVESGRARPVTLDVMLLSWLGEATALLGDGSLTHPTQVDLLARELLGFPLSHCSLLTYCTRRRVARALERAAARVPAEVVARAETYAGGAHDFYA